MASSLAHPLDPQPTVGASSSKYELSPSKIFRKITLPALWSWGKLPASSALSERIYLREDTSSQIWDVGHLLPDHQKIRPSICKDIHPTESPWRLPSRSQLRSALLHGLAPLLEREGASQCAYFIEDGTVRAGIINNSASLDSVGVEPSKCYLLCVGF